MQIGIIGAGNMGGTLYFPHNTGDAYFSGEVDTGNRTFKLYSDGNISLSLGGQNFSASEQSKLTETELSVRGDLKLGGSSSDASLHVSLLLGKDGEQCK